MTYVFHDDFSADHLADYQVLNVPPYNFGGVPTVAGGVINILTSEADYFALIAKDVTIAFPCRASVRVTLDLSTAPLWDRSDGQWEVGISDMSWNYNPLFLFQANGPGGGPGTGNWYIQLWSPGVGPLIEFHAGDPPTDFWLTCDIDADGNVSGGVWSAPPPDSGGAPDIASLTGGSMSGTPDGTVFHPFMEGDAGLSSTQDDWKATAVVVGDSWHPAWPYEAPTITAVQGDGGVMRFTRR